MGSSDHHDRDVCATRGRSEAGGATSTARARRDALRERSLGSCAVLYLMRHGHTELNALHEVHGRIDDPLDARGLAQAAALGQLFEGVPLTAVYASPLQRAVQTAEPVAAAAGLTVVADPDLMDRDYGPWTGHVKLEVEAEFGAVDNAPGVEPWDTFSDRVTAAFVVLAERHAGERVAVAAHDAVNQAVLGRLFPGRWPGPHAIPQRNGCWNNVERALERPWTGPTGSSTSSTPSPATAPSRSCVARLSHGSLPLAQRSVTQSARALTKPAGGHEATSRRPGIESPLVTTNATIRDSFGPGRSRSPAEPNHERK